VSSPYRELDCVVVRSLSTSTRTVSGTFDVSEISPGAYCAMARGPRGMRAESTDTDLDKVLADCRAFALRYPR